MGLKINNFNTLQPAVLAVLLFAASGISMAVSGSHASAAFPGANGKIVYVSSQDGNPEIYTMNADGTLQTRLTSNVSDQDYNPNFSPDGRKIVYSSYKFADDSFHIMLMNANGANNKDITPALRVVGTPQFSPDGNSIVFSGGPNGNNGIYTMNIKRKTVTTVITSTQSVLIDPSYTADGAQIVFRGDPFVTGYSDIFKINTNGSGLTDLTNTPTTSEEFTDVSADGTKIIFGRYESNNDNIYVMNSDGTNQTLLTSGINPHFSPDGTKFVYTAPSGGGQFDIFVKDLNSTSPGVRLTTQPPRNEQGSWGV